MNYNTDYNMNFYADKIMIIILTKINTVIIIVSIIIIIIMHVINRALRKEYVYGKSNSYHQSKRRSG